jgi:FixJ family two-component response regulator
MNVCLFDAENESVNMWRDMASSLGLRLDIFPVWRGLSAIPSGTHLVVLDQSAAEVAYQAAVLELCNHRPQRLTIASGTRVSVQQAVELMSGGALSVLQKPIALGRLRDEFLKLMPYIKLFRDSEIEYEKLSRFMSSLTTKEEHVLKYVLEGVSNKEAAQRLNVSVRTIESRRAKLYRKFEAKHVVELVRKMDRLVFLKQFFEVWPAQPKDFPAQPKDFPAQPEDLPAQSAPISVRSPPHLHGLREKSEYSERVFMEESA